MANTNTQLENKVKTQEKEIAELKRAINILQKELQRLNAGYQRNADQNRKNAGEIQRLTQSLRNIHRSID